MKSYNHHRGASESDKESLLSKELKSTSARRKLLEKGLKKDQLSKSRQLNKSVQRLSSIPTQFQKAFSIYPLMSSNTKQPVLTKAIPSVPRLRSKSPTSTFRKPSMDSTKFSETSNKLNPRKSTEKIRIIPSTRRRIEKPTEQISKVAEQFSVKKVNVNFI